MKVAVIGTGHVGLITCVALATIGHDVTGSDIDSERIALLNQGIAPFYEPGLEEALAREMATGRLAFTAEPGDAVRDASVIFICVGTPARADGEASLLAVERSATQIARHAGDEVVVVEKSTVPAGTADRLRLTLAREGRGQRFDIASNPEFLREGSALRDALEPDRIVVGVESERASTVMRLLYRPLIATGSRFIESDIPTAELAKHASNAFLALKISFANALARICELAGADIEAVAEVMGTDPRIGRAFLNAGLGYGGYCLPKDVAALERLSFRLGYEFPMLRDIDRVNREAIEAVAKKVEEAVWNLEEKRICILGLAFKPGTDDVRLSPALELARRLIASGASVVGCDPRAGANAKEELSDLEVSDDPYMAAAGAHCLVVATGWEEFKHLDLAALRATMAYPVVVDGRNLFDPVEMSNAGFSYYPTGRPRRLREDDGFRARSSIEDSDLS